MNRFNAVPIIILQMVESLESSTTPHNVKFNQARVLETVRDYCDYALSKWNAGPVKKTKSSVE